MSGLWSFARVGTDEDRRTDMLKALPTISLDAVVTADDDDVAATPARFGDANNHSHSRSTARRRVDDGDDGDDADADCAEAVFDAESGAVDLGDRWRALMAETQEPDVADALRAFSSFRATDTTLCGDYRHLAPGTIPEIDDDKDSDGVSALDRLAENARHEREVEQANRPETKRKAAVLAAASMTRRFAPPRVVQSAAASRTEVATTDRPPRPHADPSSDDAVPVARRAPLAAAPSTNLRSTRVLPSAQEAKPLRHTALASVDAALRRSSHQLPLSADARNPPSTTQRRVPIAMASFPAAVLPVRIPTRADAVRCVRSASAAAAGRSASNYANAVTATRSSCGVGSASAAARPATTSTAVPPTLHTSTAAAGGPRRSTSAAHRAASNRHAVLQVQLAAALGGGGGATAVPAPVVFDPRRVVARYRAAVRSAVQTRATTFANLQADLHAVLVQFRALAVMRYYGWRPWRALCTRNGAKAAQHAQRVAVSRAFTAWRGAVTTANKVRHAASVARCIALTRVLRLCVLRGRIRQWKSAVVRHRREERLAVQHRQRHVIRILVHRVQAVMQQRWTALEIKAKQAQKLVECRRALRRWRRAAEAAADRRDREMIRQRLRAAVVGAGR